MADGALYYRSNEWSCLFYLLKMHKMHFGTGIRPDPLRRLPAYGAFSETPKKI